MTSEHIYLFCLPLSPYLSLQEWYPAPQAPCSMSFLILWHSDRLRCRWAEGTLYAKMLLAGCACLSVWDESAPFLWKQTTHISWLELDSLNGQYMGAQLIVLFFARLRHLAVLSSSLRKKKEKTKLCVTLNLYKRSQAVSEYFTLLLWDSGSIRTSEGTYKDLTCSRRAGEQERKPKQALHVCSFTACKWSHDFPYVVLWQQGKWMFHFRNACFLRVPSSTIVT